MEGGPRSVGIPDSSSAFHGRMRERGIGSVKCAPSGNWHYWDPGAAAGVGWHSRPAAVRETAAPRDVAV